ncbi:Thiamine biosynthetic bifunctional enzyme TH1-chloroplastic [Striga hermonthica]|uniref:Thiamine biosynthetic bifunctional enzyme TH1-chloroplastic n=1 Tax=Striga hermonthica TaxID=68872 RepID=A0A9N7NY57_STRHE|nr:Thiamine biosynthetic bifunctional enzyme TH1-chloroplastic [Striga hermonthica]
MGFSLCPQPLNSSFIHHRFRPSIPLGFYRTKVSCPRAMQQGEETENAGKVSVPHVLTVAGSDSGAGAGIQADLKACAARGVYCSTVVTAVTAQNTVGVQGVNIVTEDSVRMQLTSVLSDMHPDVVKTGMLPSPGIVKILCESLKEFQVRALVVDPVMVSTSGDVLAGPLILSSLREDLLPLADVVTPNLREASVLLGCAPLKTIADMRFAAKSIHDFGPRNVLVKGGDLPASSDAVDVLFDGKEFHEFCSARIRTSNTHGTGCTLASSIAAELAREGGATIVQLREKDLDTGDFLEAARTCLKICRAHNVPFLINDRVDIALACGADGVHIGQSDMPARVARALLGPDKIIGVSCKTPEQAERAWTDGADYIGCGGVYPTNTKENNVSVGLDGLRKVCLASKLPVVAIGGIGVSNVGAVVGPGLPNLRGVAVVSAIFDRECVSSETRNLMKVILDSMDGAK